MKKLTPKQKKQYEKLVKGGRLEYVLKQGGMTGLIFAGFMFLWDYLSGDVQGIIDYLFYLIFFGLFYGLFMWYYINKKLKQK